MSVQLAPQHKVGLALRHPLLLANGTAELVGLCDRQYLGGVVAPEIGGGRRRPRHIAERPGGFALEEGPGAFSWTALRRLLRAAGDLPVLARVPARDVRGASRMARRLAGEGLAALEIDLWPGDPALAQDALAAIREACDLPLLARVPLLEALPYALASQGLADALVVAAPPRGLAAFDEPSQPRPVEVHGPLLLPLFLLAVREVVQAVDLPVVARGGVLTPADARAFLALGATAVAVDSLAFVDPDAANAIARVLAAPSP